MRRSVVVLSSAVAVGLTVDVGSRIYDSLNPQPNGLRSLYAAMPTRAASRAWGSLAQRRVPESLRSPLFHFYGWLYGVNYTEMQAEDVRSFESVQAFFTRRLRDGVRPVATRGLASPVDGRVMSCGPVDTATGLLPTVKDFTYSLGDFVGSKELLQRPADAPALFQAVLYLAPGDYHGFHAPSDVEFTERRHFAGHLLPVAPWMLRALPALFTVNERVVLLGRYTDDKGTKRRIAYVPVGATNVGSIDLSSFDSSLASNAGADTIGELHTRHYEGAGVKIPRGGEIGFFRMGSTVVLIFEANAGFSFAVKPGDKVKLGSQLGQ